MEDAGKLGPGPQWELAVALWIRPSLGSTVGAGGGWKVRVGSFALSCLCVRHLGVHGI